MSSRTVYQTAPRFTAIRAGEVITTTPLDAGSCGSVFVYPGQGGTEAIASADVPLKGSQTFGSYTTDIRLRLVPMAGALSYSTAPSVRQAYKTARRITPGKPVLPSRGVLISCTAEGMISLVQAAPDIAPLVLDLLAKGQDWPMADKIAKCIRTMLPPQIQVEEAQESSEPPPPVPPSPEQQSAMQAQQLQEQLAAAQHELKGAKLEVEHQKLQAEMAKIQGELQKASLDHQARITEAARPTEGAAGAPVEDPCVDATASALQQLSDLVSMLMEEMPPPAEAHKHNPAPQGGPPRLSDPMPGQMPAEPTGAPQSALSFGPSAMGEPAAPMMAGT